MIEESPTVREHLLSSILWFVPRAATIQGVIRISLLGSILTNKKDPKDIDFLVAVEEHLDLERLARLGRQVKGHARHVNHGADIFLANRQGDHSWRRVDCDALNCGKRQHLMTT